MHKRLAPALAWMLLSFGCGNDRAQHTAPPDGPGDAGPPIDERARMCPNAQSVDAIPQRLDAVAQTATLTFPELHAAITSACGSCHAAPMVNGGFTYGDAYANSGALLGLASQAQQMATQLATQKMPPDNIRLLDPAGYLKLGTRIQAWIDAGKPETGAFPLPTETPNGSGQQLPAAIAAAMTDIGDCIPAKAIIGQDPERDAAFASATALPAQLADTDLSTLDAYLLAQRGTVAYDVEYPLWADNAHKGRWVHVPTVVGMDGVPHLQPISLDPATGHFNIPDNTRFYKTFFKQVKETDGVVRYRKVETRLIVVRHAPQQPLFGTYVWDSTEQSATLHTAPYHDGTPFKDLVLALETDATTHATRTYAVPGRTRCNDCHQGSESDSFVLGFTPLQVNRRAMGEGGRDKPTATDEMSQLARLVDYGVIANMTTDTAPVLETSAGTRLPRNVYELQFQAYTTGNCAHCHNPKGYAVKQGVTAKPMNLAPGGGIFQMSEGQQAQKGNPQGTFMLTAASPEKSIIYIRVSQPTHTDSGPVAILHMPLHTPGVDCELVTRTGKWITSIPHTASNTKPTATELQTALDNASVFQAGCTTTNDADISWFDEDFSDPVVYAPRRGDWNDPVNGIPADIRALQLTSDVLAVTDTSVPTDFWTAKQQCQFPDAPEPPGGPAPWMIDAFNEPLHPYGQLYYQKPGAYFFNLVCANCHGTFANADTGLAKTLLAFTNGRTRVANLHDGLFGNAGANKALFDVPQSDGSVRNFAPNYLVWMASGGTKAEFPHPTFDTYVGPNGGNMLTKVGEICQLLPKKLRTAKDFDYQLLFNICTFNNPIPDAGADLTAWTQKALRNAGLSIFRYLQVDGAVNHWPAPAGSCELQYPAPPATP